MSDKSRNEQQVRNLQMRQTWIEEEIEAIANEHSVSLDDAFKSFVYGLLFDVDYDAIQPDEIVDGGSDKQLDIIRIDDDPDTSSAHIHIVQCKKTTDGFSPNILIQMRNGLSWIFERPRSDYSSLSNQLLVNKIDEIRQLRHDYGMSNLAVSVYYVTMGDAQALPQEYCQERKVLLDIYSNSGFSEFNFRELGAFELIGILNESDKAKRKIDIDIPIIYDVNRPSLLQYRVGETQACVCTITGENLARLASTEPIDAIFDLNVRPFYGTRGRVNSDIWSTCTSEESTLFWFLNNGVTMTCDRFDIITDPDEPQIKVWNAQIVNGCQTSVTLREAWERGELRKDVRVLLRIYATDNANLVEKITLTTNSQNRITDRDLRANDSVQIDTQRLMELYGYYYERKNKEFRGLRGTQRKRIVPNYRAAQAYLAIVRKKPSIARGYLLRIWSDHYKEIFSNATIEDLLLAFLIYQYCVDRSRTLKNNNNSTRLDDEIRVYGTFHLATICGYLLTEDRWGHKHRKELEEQIYRIESDTKYLEPYYDRAFEVLRQIRSESIEQFHNPTLYFKASEVQRSIAKHLALTDDIGRQ